MHTIFCNCVYETWVLNKTQFLGLSFKLDSLNLSKTYIRFSHELLNGFPKTKFIFIPLKTISIILENVAGALQRPKGMTLN